MCWAPAFTLSLLTTAVDPVAQEGLSPPQTTVFYTARLSLREHRPTDVLKLWLLSNSLASVVGSFADGAALRPDFRSTVWAALGDLGLCQDGFIKDDKGGAGLWPLALHNWVAAAKGDPPDNPAPFDTFEIGRQQRFVSLTDVLSLSELKSVEFFRSSCLLPQVMLVQMGESPLVDLDDRFTAGRLMRKLLRMSLRTLAKEKVVDVAAIEARIFDLDLALSQLQTRRARQQGMARQKAASLGASKQAAQEAREQMSEWPTNSREAAFLHKTLTWSPGEWLALSRSRRLFLFAQARPFAKDGAQHLVLSIIDALIERGGSDELESWIGYLDADQVPQRRTAVIEGERGKRILELDATTGFRERATIALHRGVAFLQAGQLRDALRSFAYTMEQADSSRQATVTLGLARRWLSFVLSRYETSDEVIATLKALVPRQEYNAVIEDLIWKAALRADKSSFERVVATVNRGGAIDARVTGLRSMASGNVGDMVAQLRSRAENEPHFALRFISHLLDKLEAEDANVRAAHAPTLRLLLAFLDALTVQAAGRKAQARTAEEQSMRATAILEGLGQLDSSELGKAQALSPHKQTFAGNVRLAPVDPLPWPFRAPEPTVPSAFTKLQLLPVEWRDASGRLVFGWKVSD